MMNAEDAGRTNERTTTADSCPGLLETWWGRPWPLETCTYGLHAIMHMDSETIKSCDGGGEEGRKSWMWMPA